MCKYETDHVLDQKFKLISMTNMLSHLRTFIYYFGFGNNCNVIVMCELPTEVAQW